MVAATLYWLLLTSEEQGNLQGAQLLKWVYLEAIVHALFPDVLSMQL